MLIIDLDECRQFQQVRPEMEHPCNNLQDSRVYLHYLLEGSHRGLFTQAERMALEQALPDHFVLTRGRVKRVEKIISKYKSASEEMCLCYLADSIDSVLRPEYLRSLIADFQRSLARLDPQRKIDAHRTRFLNAVFVAILMTP